MDTRKRLTKGAVYWTSVISVFGVVSWGAVSVTDLSQRLDQANEDRATLARQVRQLGGVPAVTGPRGDRGLDGKNGRDGANGLDGARGDTGPMGGKGDTGAAGPAGEKGDTGPEGPAGPQGPAGPEGPQGPEGKPGAPGKDGVIVCPDGYTAHDIRLAGDDNTIYKVCRKEES